MASKNTPTLTAVLVAVAALLAYISGMAAQRPAELIIRNGLIVTAVGRTDADLRIRQDSRRRRQRPARAPATLAETIAAATAWTPPRRASASSSLTLRPSR